VSQNMIYFGESSMSYIKEYVLPGCWVKLPSTFFYLTRNHLCLSFGKLVERWVRLAFILQLEVQILDRKCTFVSMQLINQ
jgi:hypothetical protein